ncbi:ParA family protein [Paenibacillus physcomitrellae]|uniref:Cobyrinic acid a,c-diamide synthase n=1 Tax=Paenibacillus physcomitrellae TaxID=1619311 RepID=A0ABQ1GMS9_9BACL|nr:ParA family protein [Paenibacillus physcomitrellae]GGA46904.1 cobyrinic acid a,c-diamide synthase [Paenibacillus physcomitrellae]
MPVVVSMINWKGGVGKTTLTLQIGIGLNKFHGKRVLLIDLDPQCNLSFLALGVESYVDKVYTKGTYSLKSVFDSYFSDTVIDAKSVIQDRVVNSKPGYVYTNVDMILSHQELVLLDLRLARSRKSGRDHKEETGFEIEKLAILKRVIDQVAGDYDYVLVDCPPNVNLVTQNAFYASDYFVVPAIPDFLSTTGISLIRDYMEKFNEDYRNMHRYAEYGEEYKDTKFGGIVFNMVDEYGGGPKRTHQETLTSIGAQHPGYVFEKYITDGDGISVAASVNLPIYAYEHLPRSNQNANKQSDYFENLINEFVTKII